MRENSSMINFMGIGCGIIKHYVDDETFLEMNKLAKQMGSNIENSLFDPDFFKYLKHPNWESLYDLKKGFFVEGLIDGYKNTIEVFVSGKRKRTIFHSDLQNHNCLFPLYNTKKNEHKFYSKENKCITVVETSIGRIQSFRINSNTIDLSEIIFNVDSVEISYGNNQPIISGIEYGNIRIDKLGSDDLITNRFALIE